MQCNIHLYAQNHIPSLPTQVEKNLQATVLRERRIKITSYNIHLITVLVNTFDKACIQYGTARKKTPPDDL